ncbi:hypothetical protein QTP88_016007 [Uroleucon formosanum]
MFSICKCQIVVCLSARSRDGKYVHELRWLRGNKLKCHVKPKEPEERITSVGHSSHVNHLQFEPWKQLQKKNVYINRYRSLFRLLEKVLEEKTTSQDIETILTLKAYTILHVYDSLHLRKYGFELLQVYNNNNNNNNNKNI